MTVSSLGSTTGMRPMGPPPGPPPSGGGPEKTMSAVAEKLGLTADALEEKLSSGSTMSSLASAAGVPQDELIATDTTAMATAIASGQRPGPPPKPEVDLSQGIDALPGALGISSSDLLERLTSGTGISELLAENPEASASLTEMQNRGALVDGYC